MEIDPRYARRIAREKAGRKVIDAGEITTAGVAALAKVDPITVARWANNLNSGFPRRLRHGVFPLEGVLAFLRSYHPKPFDPDVTDDDLVTLSHFARLQGCDPAAVYAEADHPYLVERKRPENVSTRGEQRWRLGDLKTFWTDIRPRRRASAVGRPDPLTADVRVLLERAHDAQALVTAEQIAAQFQIPLPRAERLLAAAHQRLIRDHPERDPLLPEVVTLLRPVIEAGRRPRVTDVMRLKIPRARAAVLLAEAKKTLSPPEPRAASTHRGEDQEQQRNARIAQIQAMIAKAEREKQKITGAVVARALGISSLRTAYRLLAEARERMTR